MHIWGGGPYPDPVMTQPSAPPPGDPATGTAYTPRDQYALARRCGYRYRGLALSGTPTPPDDTREMMRGHTVVLPVRPGLTLMLVDVLHFHDFSAEADMAPGLLTGLCLAAPVSGWAEGAGALSTPTGQGMTLTFGRPSVMTGCQPRGVRHQTVFAYATPDWLEENRLPAGPEFSGSGQVTARPWRPDAALWDRLSGLFPTAGAVAADSPFQRLHCEALTLDLICGGLAVPAASSGPPGPQARLQRVHDCLLADPGRDHSLSALAREAGISVSVLKARYRDTFGETVFQTLRRARLELARSLLRDGGDIARVAAQVGYDHVSNFTTAYRRRFGTPPRRDIG